MKLSFLGQTYNADTNPFAAPVAATTARFRGRAYQLRRPLAATTCPALPRRFRGIEY